jgi:hypothetical protein
MSTRQYGVFRYGVYLTVSLFEEGRVSPKDTANISSIFLLQPQGKRPLERSRHRWEVNIKKILTGIGREDAK